MTKAIKDVFAGFDFSKVQVTYWTDVTEPRGNHLSHIDGVDIEDFVNKYNESKHAKFTFHIRDLEINGKCYSSVEVTIHEDCGNRFYAISRGYNNPFTDSAYKLVNNSPCLASFIASLDLQEIKQNRLQEILSRHKNAATNAIIAAQSILDYLNK